MDDDPGKRPEDDYDGLRILGPDADGGDAEDGALPHWTEAPGRESDEGSWSALSGTEPSWGDDDAWQPGEAGASDYAEVGAGGGVSDFDPPLLPPDEVYSEDPGQFGAVPAVSPTAEAPAAPTAPGSARGRDMPTAIAVGVGLAVLALICFAVGKELTIILVAVALAAAAVEWFHNLRQVGYQPATLVGIAACATLPLATYWRGANAIPLAMFLMVVVGALWYLLGIGTERPMPNLGVTMLGVVHVGVLGSFAGLLLDSPNGMGMFISAIIVTVAYDVGAFFVGTSIGRTPLSEASPNKTVEGLTGGSLSAIAAAIIIIGIVGMVPFGENPAGLDGLNGGFATALAVGLAAAVFAPLGDLAESMLKRDLGVKDMGSLLPGHGGLLDRFDSLLFVLPAVYYVAQLRDIF
ncbi:MAG: phosphatidate cytidylyltransferase [Acidimicrobiia bacterium]|nr:phosphatidate cytidylyltransferase [Acidimicrobiia bacterium]